MASATKTNESLMFLFICLLSLKESSIDFHHVSASTNLKLPAARMRYSRLKKQLEAELTDGKYDLTKTTAETSEATDAAATSAPASASATPVKKRGAKRKKTGEDNEQ